MKIKYYHGVIGFLFVMGQLAFSPADFPPEILGELHRAEGFVERRQPGRAMPILNKILKDHPTFAPAYFVRGKFYNQTFQYKKALDDFNESLRIDPNFALGYFGRSMIAFAHEDLEATLKELNLAIENDPTLGLAYFERGRLYYYKEDFTLALKDFERASELKANIEPELYEAAYVLADPETVIAELDQAIAEESYQGLYFHNRGVAYYYLDQYSKALANFDKAVELKYAVDEDTHQLLRDIVEGRVDAPKKF